MKIYIVSHTYASGSSDLLHVFDSIEKVCKYLSPYMDSYGDSEEERKRLIEIYHASDWEECKMNMVKEEYYVPLDSSYQECIEWIEAELE